MDFVADNTVNKLILLFVLDKMEIPLTEISILEICSSQNNWINYMDCKDLLYQLLNAKFIYKPNTTNNESRYNITVAGRECLSQFFTKIPASLRNSIAKFAAENNLLQGTDYTIDDVNWVITLTDAGAEKLGMGGGSEDEEGSGEVTGETWTVLDPEGNEVMTFESLEAAQAYAEENGLTFGDDFTMNNENQTITLTADGWEKVSAGA